MNYLKKALERRLRAKIALKANYSISDAHAVYEFIKNGTPIVNGMGKFSNQSYLKGKLSASSGVRVSDEDSIQATDNLQFGYFHGVANAADGKITL